MKINTGCFLNGCKCFDPEDEDGVGIKPDREWVGLTDEELLGVMQSARDFQGRIAMTWVNHEDETYVTDVGSRIYRAIEAKLKEKNA